MNSKKSTERQINIKLSSQRQKFENRKRKATVTYKGFSKAS